ncbi:MAG: hypothetical protein L0332_24020 [Chloroflexi bacterium]|nr:hypothetical protein [Chloroflexota bacterium]MCI0650062.1 hypothetical protein [Chloroflexota bacterium]MCI0729761.1 hypothetical protein [Chloroflexota bacterium]
MTGKHCFTCLFNKRLLLLWLALLVACFGRPAQAEPDSLTFTVNNSLFDIPDAAPGNGVCETSPGNGLCTLRAAVMEANSHLNGNLGPDTIIIPAGTFKLFRTGEDDVAVAGDLDIAENVIINGAGATATIIDGNGSITSDRVFEVRSGLTASFNNLTIQGGRPADVGGGLYGDVLVNITLNQVIVQANQATDGGGIYIRQGWLAVNGSAIQGNSAGSGGGIKLDSNLNVHLSVTRSLIASNTATEDGGGLYIPYNHEVTLANTTVSSNSTLADGGGIEVVGNSILYLYNVTVANNKADSNGNGDGVGGGVNALLDDNGAVYVRSSLLANNATGLIFPASDDCRGSLTSQGFNLIEAIPAECSLDGSASGNITGQDPLLGVLANNGGLTQSHALLAGSPAIDKGTPSGCTDALGLLPTDQRGYERHADGGSGGLRCDMGAYEYSTTGQQLIYLPLVVRP